MEPAQDKAEPRRRGSIRPHYGGFQARVTAGVDPTTGERIVLYEVAQTRREAERALTRLLGEADAWKTARTKATFGALLDRWLAGHEVATYPGEAADGPPVTPCWACRRCQRARRGRGRGTRSALGVAGRGGVGSHVLGATRASRPRCLVARPTRRRCRARAGR
jgi:hypothetical protein